MAYWKAAIAALLLAAGCEAPRYSRTIHPYQPGQAQLNTPTAGDMAGQDPFLSYLQQYQQAQSQSQAPPQYSMSPEEREFLAAQTEFYREQANLAKKQGRLADQQRWENMSRGFEDIGRSLERTRESWEEFEFNPNRGQLSPEFVENYKRWKQDQLNPK